MTDCTCAPPTWRDENCPKAIAFRESLRCTASSGLMSCDPQQGHDRAHYNDRAGTLFRT